MGLRIKKPNISAHRLRLLFRALPPEGARQSGGRIIFAEKAKNTRCCCLKGKKMLKSCTR